MLVTVIDTATGEAHLHEADYVDYVTDEGHLRVVLRERDNRAIGWKLYAAGHWQSIELTDPPTPDVLAYRAAAAERDRAVPVNGGRGFAVGNSGPT